MGISSISHFEGKVSLFEITTAQGIKKPILNKEMYENNTCICSDVLNLTALILCLVGAKILSWWMSDNFFPTCIVLNPCLSISIPMGSSMMPDLIVITLSMENKSSNHFSYSIVVSLEILSLINIFNVFDKFITAASDNKIQDIAPTACPNKSTQS